jgi:hypothetical protein
MTDRELMQMAFGALEKYWVSEGEVIKALRDRLAQPEYEFECPRCGHYCQQREWVGLTDAEILAEGADNVLDVAFARDIEAKLKEKNT